MEEKIPIKLFFYPPGLLSRIDLKSLPFLFLNCEVMPSFCVLPIFHGAAPHPLADNRRHLIKARTGHDGPRSRASPL